MAASATVLEMLRAPGSRAERRWLVTGVAGFIGSNLLETLLSAGQVVVGIDNFSTGKRENLCEVEALVGAHSWSRFTFIEGDICNRQDCLRACAGVDIVLHQAALGSVPRSIKDPIQTNAVNCNGFLNMLIAAREQGVKRFVYASSSSVYGDSPALPKVEDRVGRPLSPYAVTKVINELYAGVAPSVFGLDTIGLRYFNVFGPRQSPDGPYAAVIPLWISSMLGGRTCRINGDGETSRDFCFVENVVQANLLAGLTTNPLALNQVYNVAFGRTTTLNQLHDAIQSRVRLCAGSTHAARPAEYGPFRDGDVRHSLADVDKARQLLGYSPTHDLNAGLDAAMAWYVGHSQPAGAVPVS